MEKQIASYLHVQLERAKLLAGEFYSGLAFWCLAVLVAGSIILIAVTFLFYGAANGLGEALGEKVWLGYLVSGGGALLLSAVVIKLNDFQRERKSQKLKRLSEEIGKDWIQEHPWESTGYAALAGFVAAGTLTPRPSKEVIEKKHPKPLLLSTAAEILKGALTPFVTDLINERLKTHQQGRSHAQGVQGIRNQGRRHRHGGRRSRAKMR